MRTVFPHLPPPDEGLLKVGRQCEKSKRSLSPLPPALPATLTWAAHPMAETCAPLTAGEQPRAGPGEEELLWHSSAAVQLPKQLSVGRQLQFAATGRASREADVGEKTSDGGRSGVMTK